MLKLTLVSAPLAVATRCWSACSCRRRFECCPAWSAASQLSRSAWLSVVNCCSGRPPCSTCRGHSPPGPPSWHGLVSMQSMTRDNHLVRGGGAVISRRGGDCHTLQHQQPGRLAPLVPGLEVEEQVAPQPAPPLH